MVGSIRSGGTFIGIVIAQSIKIKVLPIPATGLMATRKNYSTTLFMYMYIGLFSNAYLYICVQIACVHM